MKVKTLTSILGRPARAIAVASVLVVGGLPATPAAASDIGPSRFAVRNCTTTKILVCAYDRADRIMEIPYHAKYVKADTKERFSCTSADRCKVAMGMSDAKIKEVLDTSKGVLIVGVVAGVAVPVGVGLGLTGAATLYLGGASFFSLMGAGMAVGGVAAVGAVVAVTAFIDGMNVGDMCQKMMIDQKKIIRDIQDDDIRKLANDARKKQIQTRWPKYKNYTIKMDQGALVWEQGNKC